jgi:hypothetical protein
MFGRTEPTDAAVPHNDDDAALRAELTRETEKILADDAEDRGKVDVLASLLKRRRATRPDGFVERES